MPGGSDFFILKTKPRALYARKKHQIARYIFLLLMIVNTNNVAQY